MRNDFHGFDQLDRSFFPDAAPEQAIREMGRALLNGDDVDETVAAFFTRYARGERGENAWADTARAEQQAMREAVDDFMAECQDVTEQDPPRSPALADAAEAYKAGRWDLVLHLSAGEQGGDSAEQPCGIEVISLSPYLAVFNVLSQGRVLAEDQCLSQGNAKSFGGHDVFLKAIDGTPGGLMSATFVLNAINLPTDVDITRAPNSIHIPGTVVLAPCQTGLTPDMVLGIQVISITPLSVTFSFLLNGHFMDMQTLFCGETVLLNGVPVTLFSIDNGSQLTGLATFSVGTA